ncbi:O-antigen ligase family protein [Winogradskyella sp. D23]|uniref:O-antigen ligase family protein n=2 Tax=Winogradskyella alexanderae TaxID=2877123 RepID=A0ABS7XST7_9FLAO|nr:O-antigen ligase family protein [Winogradskyella alexanderae]
MILLVLSCLLSIVFNEIPTFFKPYERFAAFIIVMGLVGPLIRSSALQQFRFYLLKLITVLTVAMVTISFFGITAGLPIMIGRGGFVGLFNHSMMLGPMAAISLLACVHWANTADKKKNRFIFLSIGAISFVICVAAGSRSALLAGLVGGLFYYYKVYMGKLARYVRVILLLTSIGIMSLPLWEGYTQRIMGKMAYAEKQGDVLVTRDELWSARISEFKKSPVYGIGFASVDTSLTPKFDKSGGQIEPGSSWLALLSMIGLLGFLLLAFLIFRYTKFLYRDKLMHKDSAFLGAMLFFFIIHMAAEGYVLSAGSGMFLIFWLLLGNIEFYSKKLTSKIAVVQWT